MTEAFDSRRVSLIVNFSYVGCLVLFVFGLENQHIGNVLLAQWELGMSLLIFLNIVLYRFIKNINLAAIISTLSVQCSLIVMYMTGGMEGTGVFWYYTLPIVTFYLLPRGVGYFLFILQAILTSMIWAGGNYLGLWVNYYDFIDTRQLISSYLVVGLLLAYYQRESGLYETQLNKSKEDLATRIEELNEKQSKLDANEKSLKDNQFAMLNILEDQKILENQLKIEKQGVEAKVDERTKELSAIIEVVNSGILVLDLDKNVIFRNSRLQRMFEVEAEMDFDVLSEKLNDVIKLLDLWSKVIRSGEEENIEATSIGSKFFSFRLVPILHNSKVHEVALFIRDETEDVMLSRSKDEFFSIASHELRTPLTAIRGNAEMIIDNYKEKLPDKDVVEMLNDIHEGSVRLIEIVNDFLNVSRLEMGKVDFKIEEFALKQVIEKVLENFTAIAQEKQVELKIEGVDSRVIADADRLIQVVTNLIGNAMKFIVPKGKIIVKLASEDSKAIVSVIDNGAGIPLEQQGLLFRKFQQAGSSLYTRDTSKGTGLGLYISRMLVEGMHGKIWLVKSEVGKGSEFAISLPLAK